MDVIDPTGMLQDMRRLIAFEMDQTVNASQRGIFAAYEKRPRVTLAYLKHGCAQKYVDRYESGDLQMGPVTVQVHTVAYKRFRVGDAWRSDIVLANPYSLPISHTPFVFTHAMS